MNDLKPRIQTEISTDDLRNLIFKAPNEKAEGPDTSSTAPIPQSVMSEAKAESPFTYGKFESSPTNPPIQKPEKADSPLAKAETEALSIESFEYKFAAAVAEYNQVMVAIKETEGKIADLGDRLGMTKEQVIKALVDIEDGYFHPATRNTVANRLEHNRAKLLSRDSELGQIQTDFENAKEELKILVEKETKLHTEIFGLFEKELASVESMAEINELDKIIDSQKFENAGDKEKLLTECLRKRVKFNKEKNTGNSQSEPEAPALPEIQVEEKPDQPIEGPSVEAIGKKSPEKKPPGFTEWATIRPNNPVPEVENNTHFEEVQAFQPTAPQASAKQETIQPIENKTVDQGSTTQAPELNPVDQIKGRITTDSVDIDSIKDITGHSIEADYNLGLKDSQIAPIDEAEKGNITVDQSATQNTVSQGPTERIETPSMQSQTENSTQSGGILSFIKRFASAKKVDASEANRLQQLEIERRKEQSEANG